MFVCVGVFVDVCVYKVCGQISKPRLTMPTMQTEQHQLNKTKLTAYHYQHIQSCPVMPGPSLWVLSGISRDKDKDRGRGRVSRNSTLICSKHQEEGDKEGDRIRYS
jgi:hypothetical protein